MKMKILERKPSYQVGVIRLTAQEAGNAQGITRNDAQEARNVRDPRMHTQHAHHAVHKNTLNA